MPAQRVTLERGMSIGLAVSLLGTTIEMLQPLAGRAASIVDFAQNEAGITAGIACFAGCRLCTPPVKREPGRNVYKQ